MARPRLAIAAGEHARQPGLALVSLLFASALSAQEPTLRLTLVGHVECVRCVAISPDGKTLASGGADNSLRIWDAVSGRERASIEKAADYWVDSVAFSPDGKTLASGMGGNMIKLWNVRTYRDTPLIDEESQFAAPLVAFSPDGRTLATGGRCIRHIRVFDVSAGKCAMTLEGHDEYGIRAMVFTPDGKTLLSLGVHEGVKRWDLATGKLILPALSAADRKRIEKLIGNLGHEAFLEREKASREIEAVGPLAIDVLGPALRNENAEVRSRVARLIERLETTTIAAHSLSAAAFSPDGKTLAGVTDGDRVKLWDIATGKVLAGFKPRASAVVLSLVFSPDGRMLAAACEDGAVNLWDVPAGSERAAFKAHAGAVTCLEFSADGKMLASGAEDKCIKLWEITKAK